MPRMRLGVSTIGVMVTLGLFACRPAISAPDTPEGATNAPAPAAQASATTVALDTEGLRFVDAQTGATRLLAFGSPAEQVHEAVSLSRQGPDAEQGTNPECGVGPLDYSQWDDLTLWFRDDQFVGWAANRRGLTTMDGIGVGTPRAQLESGRAVNVEASTLGTEFQAGELYGLIDDAGLVSNLWAGESCNFR